MSLPLVAEPRFVPATQFIVYVTEECNLRCSYVSLRGRGLARLLDFA